MGKEKTNEPRFDSNGARMVMRKRDYFADLGGQFSLGLMANLVGQLTYFYTDKVGAAVGGVGFALMMVLDVALGQGKKYDILIEQIKAEQNKYGRETNSEAG